MVACRPNYTRMEDREGEVQVRNQKGMGGKTEEEKEEEEEEEKEEKFSLNNCSA